MKTLPSAILFVLVLILAAEAQTLKETLDWMESTLQPTGLFGMDQNGTSRYSVVPGYLHAETTKGFSYDG